MQGSIEAALEGSFFVDNLSLIHVHLHPTPAGSWQVSHAGYRPNAPAGFPGRLYHRAVGKPWYLLTDWPVIDADSAMRIFRFYRRRWSVEDTFKFIKTSYGIEEVQMLSFEAVPRLVAYGWVAAGFLFHLGLTLEQPEVRLLAVLGGWEERKNRSPSKQVITRGLRRLIDQAAFFSVFSVQSLKNKAVFTPKNYITFGAS